MAQQEAATPSGDDAALQVDLAADTTTRDDEPAAQRRQAAPTALDERDRSPTERDTSAHPAGILPDVGPARVRTPNGRNGVGSAAILA